MEPPVRIEVEGGERVMLTWDDGSTTTVGARRLREACECATCLDPTGHRATREVLEGPEPVTITDARLVGAYAVNFTFEPGHHHTGIFTFATLRELGDQGSGGG